MLVNESIYEKLLASSCSHTDNSRVEINNELSPTSSGVRKPDDQNSGLPSSLSLQNNAGGRNFVPDLLPPNNSRNNNETNPINNESSALFHPIENSTQFNSFTPKVISREIEPMDQSQKISSSTQTNLMDKKSPVTSSSFSQTPISHKMSSSTQTSTNKKSVGTKYSPPSSSFPKKEEIKTKVEDKPPPTPSPKKKEIKTKVEDKPPSSSFPKKKEIKWELIPKETKNKIKFKAKKTRSSPYTPHPPPPPPPPPPSSSPLDNSSNIVDDPMKGKNDTYLSYPPKSIRSKDYNKKLFNKKKSSLQNVSVTTNKIKNKTYLRKNPKTSLHYVEDKRGSKRKQDQSSSRFPQLKPKRIKDRVKKISVKTPSQINNYMEWVDIDEQ